MNIVPIKNKNMLNPVDNESENDLVFLSDCEEELDAFHDEFSGAVNRHYLEGNIIAVEDAFNPKDSKKEGLESELIREEPSLFTRILRLPLMENSQYNAYYKERDHESDNDSQSSVNYDGHVDDSESVSP